MLFNIMNKNCTDYKDILINIIKKHLPHSKIYLFGSRARSTHSPGSDIDIAIDAGIPIERAILGALKEEIVESNIPLFVDIIDLNDISEDIRQQIKKEGVLWDKNN